MRVIATILLLVMTVQTPMALNVSAKSEASDEETVQTMVFEVNESDVEEQETAGITVLAAVEAETEVEPEATEEVEEEIVYKEIVKADPIDTSKPRLQSATGTMASSNGASYSLTEYERDLIERVVMAEIGGGTYNDKLAVAQCILDRVRHYGMSVEQVIYQKNAFTDPSSKTPSKSVKQAVSDVFDGGKRVTVEPIFFFIATYAVTADCFHETQRCIYVTDAHRYYTTW